MKKIYVFVACFCVFFTIHAQSNVYNFLLAGEDRDLLLQSYYSPIINGIANGVNNGWYNTAKAHKTLGGEILITANLAYFGDSDLTYFVPPEGLPGGTRLLTPIDGNAPTVIGADITPTFESNGQVFDGPSGAEVKSEFGGFVPTPMVQIGVGVFKNTDVKFRFLPEQKIGDDGKVSMIGFGVLHDIGQHLSVVKDLPIDLSIFAGYTKIESTVDYSGNSGIGTTMDQKGVFDGQAWTFQALVGKKLSFLTLYGSVGYDMTKFEYQMKGTYTFNTDLGGPVTYTDPVNMNFDTDGFRGTVGARVSLAVFKLWADYTLKDQNVLTVGLGFSFREE